MASFADYAALVRQLHEQQRAGEDSAARATQHRTALTAALDQLDQRLALQQQRLAQLAQVTGHQPPPPVPHQTGADWAAPPAPAGPPPPPVSGPPSQAVPPSPPVSGPRTQAGPPYPGVPGSPVGSTSGGYGVVPGPPGRDALPPRPAGHDASPPPASGWQATAPGQPTGPGQATVPGQGSVTYPGRMDHDERAAGGATRMLPAVPAPRTAQPDGYAPTADPVRELELARQRADEADAAASRAETIAQHPPLLPTWSPLARAVTVYLAFSAVAALIQLVPVLVTDDTPSGTFTLFAWVCAGLPAMAFFAAYFVLATWGKPKIVLGKAEAYARIGFAICFAVMPLAYCGWNTIMRTIVSS